MKKHIPNFITCLNLFSGCVAACLAFNENYQGAFAAILLAAVFDFLDGFAARLLKAYSPMGKELDSLADMVSFGLAPGAIVFSFLSEIGMNEWVPYLAFLIPVFSGLRLAKFNIDDRQATSFIGLPVPANAIFWAGLVYSFSPALLNNSWVLLPLIGLFCYLLIARLPMFSLKFKNLNWIENQTQYLFLLGCALILALYRQDAFALIIGWYIVLSAGLYFVNKAK
ncbi:MAG: CDP-diacylglycerol--serine O-phosphatidyltransferase [Bacteroidota bacterium]|nr:CDP-diacylglycerol--serine O-phosphatidyltransferase [Bacteroidota bacterium]